MIKTNPKILGTQAKLCFFAVALSLVFVQCRNADIAPRTAEVSLDKQRLKDVNIYLSQKEQDVLNAYIYRQKFDMQPRPSGYYVQILQRGNGATINKGDKVSLEAKFTLLNGALCYNYDAAHPLEFVVGKSTAISGLHIALEGLQQGTNARFLFSSHLAHGLLGDGNKIPPNSPLQCEVKITNVEKE